MKIIAALSVIATLAISSAAYALPNPIREYSAKPGIYKPHPIREYKAPVRSYLDAHK